MKSFKKLSFAWSESDALLPAVGRELRCFARPRSCPTAAAHELPGATRMEIVLPWFTKKCKWYHNIIYDPFWRENHDKSDLLLINYELLGFKFWDNSCWTLVKPSTGSAQQFFLRLHQQHPEHQMRVSSPKHQISNETLYTWNTGGTPTLGNCWGVHSGGALAAHWRAARPWLYLY